MPEKSLQVTRLRLVTWKDFSGICDLEKPILALPPHRIVSLPFPEQFSHRIAQNPLQTVMGNALLLQINQGMKVLLPYAIVDKA